MASINLTELQVTGAQLFQDSESFLNDLSNLDDTVHGGNYAYSSSTGAVLGIVEKGFEFGVITIGIDAIGHLAKSFSDNKVYY
ncbi:hypothetical protein CLI64_07305 [Nostoc sp. CENA543]|uniref:hypothetical protein n=1 Tax=Nostoc sp. CENA543 TaxID=1869241 RepID=UPI000CA2E7B4|nr:hypothetical protein [Nostoc sp. CENA543]AUT00202.1 hypothetical protein CLI64_07305 [Nostoc sp. CENA543]